MALAKHNYILTGNNSLKCITFTTHEFIWHLWGEYNIRNTRKTTGFGDDPFNNGRRFRVTLLTVVPQLFLKQFGN